MKSLLTCAEEALSQAGGIQSSLKRELADAAGLASRLRKWVFGEASELGALVGEMPLRQLVESWKSNR